MTCSGHLLSPHVSFLLPSLARDATDKTPLATLKLGERARLLLIGTPQHEVEALHAAEAVRLRSSMHSL